MPWWVTPCGWWRWGQGVLSGLLYDDSTGEWERWDLERSRSA